MTGMRTDSNKPLAAQVVFLYKGANRPADATARVVHQLAGRLQAAGLMTSVHGMDDRTHPHRPRPVDGGIAAQVRYGFGKARDLLAESRFLLQTAVGLTRLPDDPQVIVSVDYPTGIGLTPFVARKLGRRKLHTISWVMDDFQDQKLASHPWALDARLRRIVDRLALRTADIVVTIGTCMADRIAREVLDNRSFAHGVLLEPACAEPAGVTYSLNRRYDRLTTVLAVASPDSEETALSYRMTVDGRDVGSGDINAGDGQQVQVNLDGGGTLRIEAAAKSGSCGSARLALGDPMLKGLPD